MKKLLLSAGLIGAAASFGVNAQSNVSGSGYIVGLGYDVPIDKTFDFRAAYNYLGNISGISGNTTNRFSVGILNPIGGTCPPFFCSLILESYKCVVKSFF